MTAAAKKTILVADDDAGIRTVLTQALRRAGYDVEATDNGATLYQWAIEGRGDLVITDVMMPGENGIDLIPKIHRRLPQMKVIVMSAQNALTTAVSAVEKGALDFLPKPFDITALLDTVEKSLQIPGDVISKSVETAHALDKSFVIGQSPAMQDIYRTIARLRASDLTVLINGESGTGKEVVARALHAYSRWKEGPFVAVNMAALPKNLIESELFGHEKGAFTGATQRSIGRFEQAAGGTLFLDEIGDLPYEAQTRLLRVLQENEFTTVGGRRAIKTNVRIITATHQDLKSLVRAGKFREDLYYRLNVVAIDVPPLRNRRQDISALVQHFIGQSGQVKVFAPDAMAVIEAHSWPGNIRELENLINRLCALSSADIIDAEEVISEIHRGGAIREKTVVDAAGFVDMLLSEIGEEDGIYDHVLRQVEKPLIERVLGMTGGNQIRAAEILGLNRNTLRKKIRDLDIDVRKGS